MILRRSKTKKLKKAQQLQEAQQQAFLASLQQQGAGMMNNGGGFPTAGLFEKDEEFLDGSSGSDPDGEILDSLSLTSAGQLHARMSNGRDISPPYHANTLPTNAHLQNSLTSPQHFGFPVATTVPANTTHSFRRGQSHPVFTSIPATVAEAVTTSTSSSHAHHVRQKSNGIGSPKRMREQRKQINSELITTALSLGLGRGIDATERTPWLSKKPYQVRRVNGSVSETNEGGLLMNYDHEVQSFADSEDRFLSSLTPPESTVAIHIEDELDRNVSSSRRIVGRKVVNRSISFQADFEEKHTDGDTVKLAKESFLIPKDPAEVVYNTQTSGYTFEERVSQWLLHKLARKYNLPLSKMDESPVDYLAKVIHSKPAQNVESEIKAGCQELVQGLRVTHYVTGIQLGAVEYCVMSDGQYHKKIALEGAFGVDKLATILSTQQMKLNKKESKKCSQLRHIGKIENDHIAKGTQDEAVLEIRVQPITRLIKLPILKSSLSTALEKYMEGTPSTEGTDVNNSYVSCHFFK